MFGKLPQSDCQTLGMVWGLAAALFAGVVLRGSIADFGVMAAALGAFAGVMWTARNWCAEAAASADQPTARAPETKAMAVAPAPAPAAAAVDAVRPMLMAAPPAGGPDDLKRISGVGPKLEAALHEIGVYRYSQIASWSPQEVAWMDENLVKFKGRVSRDDWVSQATLLAAGETTSFAERVDRGEVPTST